MPRVGQPNGRIGQKYFNDSFSSTLSPIQLIISPFSGARRPQGEHRIAGGRLQLKQQRLVQRYATEIPDDDGAAYGVFKLEYDVSNVCAAERTFRFGLLTP